MNKEEGKIEAIRKDIYARIEVRKMSNDEIDNSEIQYYADDETGCIYKEQEIEILDQNVN